MLFHYSATVTKGHMLIRLCSLYWRPVFNQRGYGSNKPSLYRQTGPVVPDIRVTVAQETPQHEKSEPSEMTCTQRVKSNINENVYALDIYRSTQEKHLCQTNYTTVEPRHSV